MHSYHVDVAIKRAKEDECDTCIRLSVALENKNLTADERTLLEEQQLGYEKNTNANSVKKIWKL